MDLVQISKKDTPSSSFKIVFVLATIATICGVLIAIAVQVTRPLILRNQQLALKKAILEIIPEANKIEEFYVNKTGQIEEPLNKLNLKDYDRYFAVFGEDKKLIAVMFEGKGRGYADEIKILFAYDPVDESLVGIKVTSSNETPGLGDQIKSNLSFLANFVHLPLAKILFEDEHKIEAVKGEIQHEWEISVIAGATVTSQAVANIVSISGRKAIPVIKDNLEIIKRGFDDREG